MSGTSSNKLKSNLEKILKLWTERALAEVPSASTAETLALRDSLPMYLSHLAEALAENRKMDLKSVGAHDLEAIRIGRLHGADRAGTASYVLTEVIFEYHILREVIFQVLESDGQLCAEERDIILDSVEQAVNDAAVKFSEVHADIQQKFINTLTHDLKTPLTTAKLAAQLILKRSDRPDDCLRSAGRIIGNLNRLDSMIHNLLDASRLRAGEPLTLQMDACDLVAITRDVVDDMSDTNSGIIHLNAPHAIEGKFSCDGFRRAAENLIGNALKYSIPNTPIQVSLQAKDQAILLSVQNQGPVIPDAELAILFEQYRRSKSAEKSAKTGWGIGLTLVKGVADAHEGKAWAESTSESGTTFFLEIPQSRNA